MDEPVFFDDGARAHFFVSWLHPAKERRLTLIGSEKMVAFDDLSKELVLYDQHVDWREGQPIPVRGEGTLVQFPEAEPLKEECRHFIDRMADRRPPRTDGRNGLNVLQILHAAQRSLITNGQPVPFSLAWPGSGEGEVGEVKPFRPHVSAAREEAVATHAKG